MLTLREIVKEFKRLKVKKLIIAFILILIFTSTAFAIYSLFDYDGIDSLSSTDRANYGASKTFSPTTLMSGIELLSTDDTYVTLIAAYRFYGFMVKASGSIESKPSKRLQVRID